MTIYKNPSPLSPTTIDNKFKYSNANRYTKAARNAWNVKVTFEDKTEFGLYDHVHFVAEGIISSDETGDTNDGKTEQILTIMEIDNTWLCNQHDIDRRREDYDKFVRCDRTNALLLGFLLGCFFFATIDIIRAIV